MLAARHQSTIAELARTGRGGVPSGLGRPAVLTLTPPPFPPPFRSLAGRRSRPLFFHGGQRGPDAPAEVSRASILESGARCAGLLTPPRPRPAEHFACLLLPPCHGPPFHPCTAGMRSGRPRPSSPSAAPKMASSPEGKRADRLERRACASLAWLLWYCINIRSDADPPPGIPPRHPPLQAPSSGRFRSTARSHCSRSRACR